MTKKELMKRVNFRPKQVEYNEEVKYSSKLDKSSFDVRECTFVGFTVNGNPMNSNVLAEKNDAAAMAMCKDAK